MRELFSVQNTYLSTFQSVGGLGLLLGTVGIAAVLLRNVWERRRELALLRALGYSRRLLGWLVLAEHLTLVMFGLAAGVLSAGVVTLPHVLDRTGLIPWASLAGMIAAVLATGILASLLALRTALRTPLLPALRSE